MPSTILSLSRLALWTAMLAVFFILVLILPGSNLPAALASFMVLGGLGLVLAAFPAGIAVSGLVLAEESVQLRPVAEFALATVAVALLVLLLVGWVGPTIARSIDTGSKTSGLDRNAMTMTLGELRAAAVVAVERAESDSAGTGAERWRSANILVWHYVRRLAGVAQALFFAWLGLLAGFWARQIGRRDLEQVQYWALGLFLLVSTYLAGENSFELIALQAAGPAFFAGWFVLIVPAILMIGLGWPTAMVLWSPALVRSER